AGEAPGQPPGPGRGGRPLRFVARRTAWHALDHAWEIQDRQGPARPRRPRRPLAPGEPPGAAPVAHSWSKPPGEGPGSMAAAFDEATRDLLDGRNFATVATLNPDGGPQTSVVWILREGGTVAFSTTAGRRKARNLARDPRVSVSVFDTGNPYHS